MKKIILTATLLCCMIFIFSVPVSAEEMRYPAQQGMPGNPPPEDQMMMEGTPPPGQNTMMMQKQGQPPAVQKKIQQNVQNKPLKAPVARETIMDRREDKMQLRQDMISGVKQMKEEMRDATNPGELKDMRQQMRMDIHKMAGQMREIKKENLTDRCKNVVGRISRITTSAGNGIGGKQKAFQAIADRFSKLSEKLVVKGVDVTELDAAIATLNEKIQILETDYAAFIDSLDNTQQYECGNSEGEFKEAREAAAPAFEQVQKDKMDIEEFLKNDMKAVLEELRKNVPTGVAPTQQTPDDPVNAPELTVEPTIVVN